MALHIKEKIFGFFAASAALLMSSACADDPLADFNNGTESDEVTVTFHLAPEAAAINTRSDDDGLVDYNEWHISDGSKVDMLVYAVYRVIENESGSAYDFLESYGQGSEFDNDVKKQWGYGQTIKKVDKFPYTMFLQLKKGFKYKIAFWAQNSKCDAYNTIDLRRVEVVYSETSEDDSSTLNNDETRDAFCRMQEIDLTPSVTGNITQNVYLYRPLAQINVGTEGYDFEIINRERARKYTYSKIRINRVARYLDVVDDKVVTTTTTDENNSNDIWYDPETGEYWQVEVDDNGNMILGEDGKPIKISQIKTAESFAVVDYGYAPIAAYANPKMEIPTLPSHTIYDWAHETDYTATVDGVTIDKDNYEAIYGKEEFLKVDLYEDKEHLAPTEPENYASSQYTHLDKKGEYMAYASLNAHEGKNSETFKWLSMSYVLTSSTKDDPIVINNIKVWLATDKDGSDEIEVLNINYVPAQRNWRTNIVGKLLTVEKQFEIKLDQNFAGEYNGWKADDKWEWSGPLWEGVYYNAEEDVIEISSKEGLLWLQRMVNGDLVVRETADNNALGKYYHYYDMDGIEHKLNDDKYKPIPKPKVGSQMFERYLIATHQKFASNYDSKDVDGNPYSDDDRYWPAGNNFHFTGSVNKTGAAGVIQRDQALVRLMADIDLEGEEWIPIGFECRALDQGYNTFGVNEKFGSTNPDNVPLKDIYQLKDWTYRGFFGIFDGNGHTIYNMSTKKFGAMVHHESLQVEGAFKGSPVGYNSPINGRPYDTPVWFARGFFGMIGQDAVIRNLRLVNVDVHGYNNVGGIVGYAYGRKIRIENCIVDGGKIVTIPMFRGDDKSRTQDRTYARGVNTGGIVGCFNTTPNNGESGEVNNCEVRNLTIKGFRRMGGIIGSLELPTSGASNTAAGFQYSKSHASSFCGNLISNSVFIASQFYPFDHPRNEVTDGIYKTGLGYLSDVYLSYAQTFIGGDDKDWGASSSANKNVDKVEKNESSNVTLLDMGIFYYANANNNAPSFYDEINKRITQIGKAELKDLPILSSWFVDKVYLAENYYGTPSAHTRTHMHRYNINSLKWGEDYSRWDRDEEGDYTFSFPMNLPVDEETDWDETSANVGVYVESVYLDGVKGEVGGRSVITPTKIDTIGACAMYVTARDRLEYQNSGVYTADATWYKQPTTIKNVVLRGDPYAWAGLMIAPNENMSTVTLENVYIYDVYKTIALDPKLDKKEASTSKANIWPNAIVMSEDQKLIVKESNLRGFTEPGAGWESLSFTKVTFEEGMNTGKHKDKEEMHTCLVESPTTFSGCYFKAPYTIIRKDENTPWTFTDDNGRPNYGTSSSSENVEIGLDFKDADKCVKIVITNDAQGNPEVYFYDESGATLEKRVVPSLR